MRAISNMAFLAGLALAAPALAQTAPPPPAPATQPDPAFEAARLAFETLPESERRAVQDALVWTGDHVGVVSGAFGRRTFEAVAAYQKRLKISPDGILPPKPRADLLAAAQRAKDAVGFKPNRDARAGVEIGLPEKLLPKREANGNGGTRWQSADGRITLDTRAQPGAEADLVALYERNLSLQSPGRQVLYKVQRPDFFVIGGETATGKFYTRAAVGPAGIRGFSLGYDKELARDLDRTVIAVANSFVPFPAATGPAVAAQPGAAPASIATTPPRSNPPVAPTVRPPVAEPPRPAGPIATGLAVGPRRVLTVAAVSACSDLRAGGAPARLIKAENGVAVLEAAARPGASALRPGPLPAGEALVIPFYSGGSGSANLVVAPGEAVGAGRLLAPLQPGAAGAPVFDRSGALVGLIGPLPSGPRLVAGVVPPTSYPLLSSEAAAGEFTSPSPTAPTEGASGPMSAGAITARVRASLVPIECAR